MAICSMSYAQIKATTSTGKKVVLSDNGTWNYAETKSTATVSKSDGNIHVVKETDEMTDKVYYYLNEKLVCQNAEKTKGFALEYNLKGKTDAAIKVSGLMLKVIGLDCLEKTQLLFLFEDASKFSTTSWNKFNCKGNAWYSSTPSQLKQLAEKKIKKIRVQNGRNYKSYTHELSESEMTYLMDTYKAIQDKDIRAKQ